MIIVVVGAILHGSRNQRAAAGAGSYVPSATVCLRAGILREGAAIGIRGRSGAVTGAVVPGAADEVCAIFLPVIRAGADACRGGGAVALGGGGIP